MIRFLSYYLFPGEGGGDGGAEGGAEGGGGHWTADHAYFQNNPEAAKSFADFKSADDVFKSYTELRQKQSGPFRLPKDLSKLSKEQRAEWQTGLAKLHGVPEAPDGYEFDSDSEVPDHEPTLEKFRTLLHERGIDRQTAKDLLGLQRGMVKELNAHRNKVIEGMTNNNYKTFLNEDCGGDKELAAQKMEQVKQYLQTQFTKDGTIDTAGWEKFAARLYHGDRIIELPILRALSEAAQMKMGTGGAPGGSAQARAPSGKQPYAEMKRK